MKNVKIEILNRGHAAFVDTVVGKAYDAFLLEVGDTVPDEFTDEPGMVNEEGQAILFFDETATDCACNTNTTENVYFKYVE